MHYGCENNELLTSYRSQKHIHMKGGTEFLLQRKIVIESQTTYIFF